MTTATSNKAFLLAATPLFLVLFIDSMGLGLVVPILNQLIISPSSHFLPLSISSGMRNFAFGATMGIFMLCWFFGASFLGDLSDQIGRKKSLMICLLGAFVGYLISAIGVMTHSFALLLLGRIIAGFTAGSQSIAQAAIVDISPPEHKARNLGLILFFISIGFIFGPLIGGLLSESSLISWFDYSTPFYFAAIIALLNAGLLNTYFQETFHKTGKVSIKLHRAIEVFISAFQDRKVRSLSFILLVMIFGWSGFYSFISMFLLREYGLSSMHISLYMALMGAGFGFGTGILVEHCTQRYSLKNNVVVGLCVSTLAALVTVIAPRPLYAWLAIVPLAASMAVAYSVLLTLFSNQVDEDSQGWVMGITGAIMAFAFFINGVFVGLLADLSPSIPLITTVIGLSISAIMMYFYRGAENVSRLESISHGHL